LIHLAKIGELEILRDIFEEVLVPEAVYRECVIEVRDRDDASKIKTASWIRIAATCSYISPTMETFKYIIDFMQVLSASHLTN
jgi:predicted nucleic acid-binding protein